MSSRKAPEPWMQYSGVQQITKIPTASLTARAQNTPLQNTSQPISHIPVVPLLRAGATKEEAAKLISWSEIGKKTNFAPTVVERMARAKAMRDSAIRLIEAMRCTAQPNRHFRGERLVPSDLNAVSERIELAKGLNDTGSCFDNLPPLIQYTHEVALMELQIDQFHEIFLRQVIIFCTKPLTTFVDLNFPELLRTYGQLEKLRDNYDSTRKKKDEAKTEAARQEFLDQARVLAGLMDLIPTHQMMFAKALDSFARAEAAFAGHVVQLSLAIKQPDYRKRWSESPM